MAQPSEMICHYPNNQFECMSNHFLNFLLIEHVVSCGGGKDDYGFLIKNQTRLYQRASQHK